MNRLKRFCVSFMALLFVGLLPSIASAQVTLPDHGVDVAGYITAGITALGAILGVVLGGYISFLLIRKAMRWVGRALG